MYFLRIKNCLNQHYNYGQQKDTDLETFFLNPPFLYNMDMSVSYQQYTSLVYKTRGIWYLLRNDKYISNRALDKKEYLKITEG